MFEILSFSSCFVVVVVATTAAIAIVIRFCFWKCIKFRFVYTVQCICVNKFKRVKIAVQWHYYFCQKNSVIVRRSAARSLHTHTRKKIARDWEWVQKRRETNNTHLVCVCFNKIKIKIQTDLFQVVAYSFIRIPVFWVQIQTCTYTQTRRRVLKMWRVAKTK